MPVFFSLAPLYDGSVITAKLANDAVTLAKLAHGTAGNLITFDAAGAPAAVATGNAAQILTSNGAGAAPTFQAAAAGSQDVALIHSGAVSTNSGVEAELDSHVVGAGAFAINDTIWVLVEGFNPTGGGNAEAKIRINDGTNTVDVYVNKDNNFTHSDLKFIQSTSANTQLLCFSYEWNTVQGGGAATIHPINTPATMIANWLSAGFTISLRGFTNATGTAYYNWKVYKIKA